MRECDVELFEDNPEEFIRRDLEGSDVDTRRRAACDLVKGLSRHFEEKITQIFGVYVQSMLAQYSADPKANWKSKDAALYLVTSLATLLAILLLSTVPELNYQPVPIILAIFGSFSIATCFSSIYAMAVDTIFLCVLEDLELHDGSPDDPYFMDMDIQNIVAK